jgi:hypothetical protein
VPTGPIAVETIVRKNPALRLHVARIDLTHPQLEVVVAQGGADPDGAGPWETTLMPVSAIARREKLDLAINTVFFMCKNHGPDKKIYVADEWAKSANLVVSDGKVLSRTGGEASLVINPENRATIQGVRGVAWPAGADVVAGNMHLVIRGQPVDHPHHELAPRTAAGLSEDGKTLILVVVDGRRPGWSVGLGLEQLGREMTALGCFSAINLDGGGSSAMVRREGNAYSLVNLPSDGSTLPLPLSFERPVPYVLGFRVIKN